jgi:hypothetical protein
MLAILSRAAADASAADAVLQYLIRASAWGLSPVEEDIP